MKNLLLILLLTGLGFAQQSSTISGPPFVINQNGSPVSSVLVTVCTTNPGTGVCSTPVTTYTDNTLVTACTGTNVSLNSLLAPSSGTSCSNPGHTDGFGNVVIFASSGFYWCQYSGRGLNIYSQPCMFPVNSSGITLTTPSTGFQCSGSTGGNGAGGGVCFFDGPSNLSNGVDAAHNSSLVEFKTLDTSGTPQTFYLFMDTVPNTGHTGQIRFVTGTNYGIYGVVTDGVIGVDSPGFTLATLNAAPWSSTANGMITLCSDCKNVQDDGATAGATCIGVTGHGAFAKRENSRWDCN